MAYTQTAITNALLDTTRGTNTLVNDLARRRLYDSAVQEFNAKDRRPKINFSKAVNEAQTLIATNAYPEFQINFYNTQNAVHSLAGGLRMLELEYLMMQVPYGSTTYDIGGNFAAHMFKGRSYVHCCAPNLDIRDIMRHESQKDSVDLYLSRLKNSAKSIPHFQFEAFRRYAEYPQDVICNNKFQECERGSLECSNVKTYAISLHSLYDIPWNELGPALLRKNVHTCFAAFHFSEELLLENSRVSLDEIGAVFTRDGEMVNFSFLGESTLDYTHKFSNILAYVCKTYFVASSTEVYIKEFMVTRVNTWFCKFTRVNTLFLHKSVHSTSIDHDQLAEAIEDAWMKKKSLALVQAERVFIRDSATVNFWFPSFKDKVLIPLFDISIETGKRTSSEVMVSRDFVYTVLNHIKTYQQKALTYNNVLSFVESIRSRVIINGVTARSEWDVDKSILQSLAMTFFLQTKLATLKDELLISKFDLGPKSAKDYIFQEISNAVSAFFPSIKERLIANKIIVTSEKALEIHVPDLYVSFHDKLLLEFKKCVEMPTIDITKELSEAESMYIALSELSVLKTHENFDVELFSKMCIDLDVNPTQAAKVIVAVLSGTGGLSLTFKEPTEKNVADALPKNSCVDMCMTSNVDPTEKVSFASSARTGKIPVLGGLCEEKIPDDNTSDQLLHCVSDYHMKTVESVQMKKMASIVYTGSIKVQQMKNYMDSLSASISATVSNLKKLLLDVVSTDATQSDKVGVYDVNSKNWLIKPTKDSHAWGVVQKTDRKCYIVLLSYDEGKMICDSDWVKVAVSTETLVYSDMAKLKTLQATLKDGEPHVSTAKVTLVDGVPGCGKTAEILERVNFDTDLILVPGKQAAAMIRKRANASGSTIATHDNVRTVDSFLMNYCKSTGSVIYKTLFIDEGLMLHPGCVNFLVSLSFADEVFVYGDTQQIPYINRVQNFPFPAHFAKLEVDHTVKRRTTKRCPADVTHFLNSRYDGNVTCVSDTRRSVSQEMLVGSALMNPVGKPLNGKILTFTQADKHTLLERGYKDVNTVHEIQGDTFEQVNVVRLTATPLTIISRDSPHVLVALSRHTKSFKYYTVVLDPLVSVVRDLEHVSDFLLDIYKVESGAL
nr:MAG: replication-associated protein [Piper chlorosis virus]